MAVGQENPCRTPLCAQWLKENLVQDEDGEVYLTDIMKKMKGEGRLFHYKSTCKAIGHAIRTAFPRSISKRVRDKECWATKTQKYIGINWRSWRRESSSSVGVFECVGKGYVYQEIGTASENTAIPLSCEKELVSSIRSSASENTATPLAYDMQCEEESVLSIRSAFTENPSHVVPVSLVKNASTKNPGHFVPESTNADHPYSFSLAIETVSENTTTPSACDMQCEKEPIPLVSSASTENHGHVVPVSSVSSASTELDMQCEEEPVPLVSSASTENHGHVVPVSSASSASTELDMQCEEEPVPLVSNASTENNGHVIPVPLVSSASTENNGHVIPDPSFSSASTELDMQCEKEPEPSFSNASTENPGHLVPESNHSDQMKILDDYNLSEKRKIFIRSQVHDLKKKYSYRWNPEMLKFCKALYSVSPKSYKYLVRSRYLILPSARHIRRLMGEAVSSDDQMQNETVPQKVPEENEDGLLVDMAVQDSEQGLMLDEDANDEEWLPPLSHIARARYGATRASLRTRNGSARASLRRKVSFHPTCEEELVPSDSVSSESAELDMQCEEVPVPSICSASTENNGHVIPDPSFSSASTENLEHVVPESINADHSYSFKSDHEDVKTVQNTVTTSNVCTSNKRICNRDNNMNILDDYNLSDKSKIFFLSQLQNSENKYAYRWSPVMMRFCKALYSVSPKGYKYLVKCGYLILPCARHIRKLIEEDGFSDDQIHNETVPRKVLEENEDGLLVDMAVQEDGEQGQMLDEDANDEEWLPPLSQSSIARARYGATRASLRRKQVENTSPQRLRKSMSGKDSSGKDSSRNGGYIKELERQLARERRSKEKLLKMIKSRESQLSDIIQSNSYYLTIEVDEANIQVGDSNVQNVSATSGLESSINKVERLLNNLTTAVDENIQKRAKCKQELRGVEIQLKELTSSIKQLQMRCKDFTTDDAGRMSDLKHMLDALTRDRSDEAVLTECVASLKDLTKRQMVDNFDALPAEARAGVVRLVLKFEEITWEEFAAALGVNTANVRHVETTDGPLDNENCTDIMLEWIKASCAGDTGVLLQMVQELDNICTQDIAQIMQEQTTGIR